MGHALAANAYATLDPALTSPKRAEARVFSRATDRLRAVFADETASMASRAAVLADNRRLWLAAAVESADDRNPMPDDLRAGLIGLAAFVDRHTSAVLQGTATADALIEINARIAAGLSREGA